MVGAPCRNGKRPNTFASVERPPAQRIEMLWQPNPAQGGAVCKCTIADLPHAVRKINAFQMTAQAERSIADPIGSVDNSNRCRRQGTRSANQFSGSMVVQHSPDRLIHGMPLCHLDCRELFTICKGISPDDLDGIRQLS